MALPPIIPAPRGNGGKAAQRSSQRQKAAAFNYRPPPHARIAPPTFPAPHQQSFGARIGHAIGHIGHAAQHATHSASTPHRSPAPGGDVQSGGGYGRQSARANSFKQSPAYRQAIIDTFLHQPKPQALAILRGALRTPSYEGGIVLQHMRSNGFDVGLSHSGALKLSLKSPTSTIPVEKFLSDVARTGAGNYGGGKAVSGSGVLGAATPFAKNTLGREIAVNSGKDAVNLPAEAVTTVGTLGGDVLSHNFKKLGSDVIAPYKQLLNDPGQALKHPLDTYLMVAGPVHGATRLASGAARAVAPESALARAGAPTVPSSVKLTGRLTHERPAFSQYPLVKAGQKAGEAIKYKRVDGRTLVPRSENVRARLTRKEVSRSLVGTRERIRRAGVQLQVQAHAKRFLASTPKKVAHGAKTVLSYNPGSALIHGANIAALIADHTIRSKATFRADLQKHLDAVLARRPALDGQPNAIKDFEATVAHLRAALNDKALRNPKNLDKLFTAAHEFANDTKPLTAELFSHDHFGKDMTQEGLLRRELQPVVLSHMHGARLDPKLGMVVDTPHGPRPLSTQEMVAFDKAQTGGRPLAYTSHQAPKGDSAFYTNQQKYPAREMKRNSGYAYQHGLRDVTHEALLQQRVDLENKINAHRAMDKILSTTVLRGEDVPGSSHRGFWRTGDDAAHDAPPGYVPIRVGRMTSKGDGAAPTVEDLSNEANLRSLDLNERLRATDEAGQWGLIDGQVADQLRKHQDRISPNTFDRAMRGTTGQFRKVALGLSVRHLPGIVQEGLIRDIGNGVFVQHLATGKNVLNALGKLDPRTDAEKLAGVPREHAAQRFVRERQTELAGGMLAGMTRALATRQGSRHFEGTVLQKPMRAFEAFAKAPGARQLNTAWNAWTHVVIDGTKRVVEQNQQTAALGKALNRQVGRAMALQGRAAEEAAKGLLSDTTARQLRSEIQRIMGTWTDMTPSGQTAMMYSPFGMWWVNSVKWLGRMPIDQPVKLGLLASATVGTEKQRNAEGLDMFSPNALPGYLQGSLPIGKKLYGQQYYSPFGVAGDPANTAASLMEPTFTPFVLALLGDNYLGRSLRSPTDPHGHKIPSQGVRSLIALNSVLANFVPFWQKAQTVRQGGASGYDTSTQFDIQTKTKNGGFAKGLEKAVQPLRVYPRPASSGASGSAHPDPFHPSRSGNPDPFHGANTNPDPFK